MENHIEDRSERIEKGFEETKEILKNTVTVLNRTADMIEENYLRSREYQKRLDLLGTDWDEQREK